MLVDAFGAAVGGAGAEGRVCVRVATRKEGSVGREVVGISLKIRSSGLSRGRHTHHEARRRARHEIRAPWTACATKTRLADP